MIDRNFIEPRADFDDAAILITGGTGSFGKAMVRHLLDNYSPRRIAIYSRDEFKHFQFENTLSEDERKIVRFFIGDVRDRDRLIQAMSRIDIVIHAAALKQVPTAEYNPFECIRTNVIGAENVVQASIQAGVSKVMALSTDKAANPINLYGASKLAADKIFIAGNSFGAGSGTFFSVVRYGNVFGSRGSIIPFFRQLRDEGADALPITDDRMTRFWITLDQAVQFVGSSIATMRGAEIFVPKIPSMKITDIAEAVAPGMKHKIIGIRPGEKLHELMIDEHSARSTVDLGDRFAIEPDWQFWPRKSFRDDGFEAVAENFQYSSDSNDEWMSIDELRTMIDGMGDERAP